VLLSYCRWRDMEFMNYSMPFFLVNTVSDRLPDLYALHERCLYPD